MYQRGVCVDVFVFLFIKEEHQTLIEQKQAL
jgi:hypothetical protein